jgi:cold shock CspA family protein
MNKHQGVVGKYLPIKKFGFIRYSTAPYEIFFHQLEVEGLAELERGQRVEFEISSYNNKPVAAKVRPIVERPAIIPATVEEVELLKSYGVDLMNGAKVRAALAVIRSLAKKNQDGDL